MNILPKKRWHVRTKDNVARVRRDQAQAKEEEKSRSDRASLAEKESRTDFLRQRAAVSRDKQGLLPVAESRRDAKEDEVEPNLEVGGHVNFFADLEEQERTFGVNKDYANEKRLEKEAEERKIGLLKYLGEGSHEYTKETPWYQKAPERQASLAASKSTKTVVAEKKPVAEIQRSNVSFTTASSSKAESTRKRKRSKEKKKKRRRRRSTSSNSSSEESGSHEAAVATSQQSSRSSTIDIEKLRNERLRREREERLKTEAVLRRMRGEDKEVKDKNVAEDQGKQYQQKYSSQFNPDLARQNQARND